MTPSKRNYNPLVYEGCRGWGGRASPSMLLHSRLKNTTEKRRKKIPRETSAYRKYQQPAFQRSRNGTRHTSAKETHQCDQTGDHLSCPCLPCSWAGVAMAVTKPSPACFTSARGCCTTEQARPIKRNLKSHFLPLGKKKKILQQRVLLQPLTHLLGISSFGAVCSDSRAVIYPQNLFIIVISILPSSSPGAALKPSTLPLPGGRPAGKPPPSPLRLQKPQTKSPHSPLFLPLEREGSCLVTEQVLEL